VDAAEVPAASVATFRQTLTAACSTAHPWGPNRAACTAVTEWRISGTARASTTLRARRTARSIAIHRATRPTQAEFTRSADRTISAQGTGLWRVAWCAAAVLTAPIADTVSADTCIVLTCPAFAVGTVRRSAVTLARRIAPGTEGTPRIRRTVADALRTPRATRQGIRGGVAEASLVSRIRATTIGTVPRSALAGLVEAVAVESVAEHAELPTRATVLIVGPALARVVAIAAAVAGAAGLVPATQQVRAAARNASLHIATAVRAGLGRTDACAGGSITGGS
jgi:hypothetical protein